MLEPFINNSGLLDVVVKFDFAAPSFTIRFSAPDPSVPNKNGPILSSCDLVINVAEAASLKIGLLVLSFLSMNFEYVSAHTNKIFSLIPASM